MGAINIRNNRVMIDIACNDPDNGTFNYRAEMIEIGRDLLELEARSYWRPPRFVEVPNGFRLSGKFWPTCGSKDWVGNWCWNGYWMEIPTAVHFLAWLHRRNLFHCTCGEERIFNRWRWREPFDNNHLEFLDRMLGKPSNWYATAWARRDLFVSGGRRWRGEASHSPKRP